MGRLGNEASFRAFFEAESAALQRFGTFMCGDPDLAADLTQEALTRAYKRWFLVRRPEAPAYVRRIIVNLVRDAHRRRGRTGRPGDLSTETVPSHAHRVEDWIVVSEALSKLTPVRRATVVLRFYEDMTEHQISVTLGRPLGTVKSDLHRALRDLRSLIETREELLEEKK